MNGKKAKQLRKAVRELNPNASRLVEYVGGEYGHQVKWTGERRMVRQAKQLYKDSIIEVKTHA